jgi:NitT/TauT family transport system ATP-binding protein
MSSVQVALRGVTKRFPASAGGQAVHALGPIDLDIRQGEFFAVVGPSGCGKSTLLELIAGLTPATEGRIEFEGRAIGNEIPDGIGVVFQEDACFPWLSVRENVEFGLRKAALGSEEKTRRVNDAIAMMGLGDSPGRSWRSRASSCSTSRSARSISRPVCSWATRCCGCGARSARRCS